MQLNRQYSEGKLSYEALVQQSESLNREKKKENALNRIENQIREISDINAETGGSYRAINHTAWLKIMPVYDFRFYIVFYIIAALFIITAVSGMQLAERETGVW